MSVAMTGIAVPNFVIAGLCQLVVLQVFLATGLRLLPQGGWGDGSIRNIILPIIALTLPQIAFIARLMRGSLIEVLRSNYVRTARAKGLREQLVLVRHSARAGLLPVVSYLGPAAAGLMTGSVIIETIFQLPGIGRYFINAALNRDYTLVMGVVIVYGAAIILFNLLVDLVYGLLDPKVRVGR
jgi:oligopeptide transport system permease protein